MERQETEQTVGEIVATLREATKNGKMKRNFASPLYNSLQKYYETTTDEPEIWRNITYSRDDFESRMATFRKRNDYEDKTAFAYKARARRAIEVYEDYIKENESFFAEGESDRFFIRNLRGYWKATLKDNLADEEKSKRIEVIQCRTYGSGFAAIIVSRDSFAADLEEEYKTIKNLLRIS